MTIETITETATEIPEYELDNEIKVNSTKKEIEKETNNHLKNDTSTSEVQTKFPEYDVEVTTESTRFGSEDEGEVSYEDENKKEDDDLTKEEIEKVTNQHLRNSNLNSEDQTKFSEYDV